MTMRTLLFLIGWATSSAAQRPSEATTPQNARLLVKQLLIAELRDAALCALIRLDTPGELADDETCRVNHIIVARQDKGGPLYVVFKEADWCEYDGPGLARGHFLIFDSNGALVPSYAGANVIDMKGGVLQSGSGGVALAVAIDYRGDVFGLHVVPVSRAQRPVLSVIVGPPGARYVEKTETWTSDHPGSGCLAGPTTFSATWLAVHHLWSWRAGFEAGSSVPSIEIGPESELNQNHSAATFRWDARKGKYVGPNGSAALGFLQISAENPDDEVARFVADHSRLRAPLAREH